MSALAVAPETTPSTPSATIVAIPEITIQVMPDGTANCLKPYVGIDVPQAGEVHQITWTIDLQYAGDLDVIFDMPGITFFGETPNVIWAAPTSLTSRTALWSNDASRRQRSYFYQIRLLRRTPKPNGEVNYEPVTVNDPVIHNDPPSDTII